MKIMIISAYTWSLVHFRGDLIKELCKKDNEVVVIAPEIGFEDELASIGGRFVQLSIERNGMNPFKDIVLYFKFKKLFKKEKPDIVLSYLIKPVIYGSLAAKAVNVKKIYALITGLGHFFTSNNVKTKVLRYPIKILYREALKVCQNIFFQNNDDQSVFENLEIVNKNKCVLINGSGVNLEYFKPAPLPSNNNFLMICRIIKEKGIIEYLQAANIVIKQYPNAVFNLVGPMDTNPTSLQKKDLEQYLSKNIRYLGETNDVRPFIQECRVYVLPSYREGTPRSVLEAMAMQRPVITTSVPGCKETVIDEKNGFLVPAKNAQAIADKMIWMIEHPAETEKMANESLALCREKYDVRKVNKVIIQTILS